MINLSSSQTSEATQQAPLMGQTFARQAALMLVLRVLVGVSVIGSGLIVARWLGSAGLGILTTIQVIVLAAVRFGSFGLPAAGTYFIALNRQNLSPVVTNALLFGVLAGSLLCVSLIALAQAGIGILDDIPSLAITAAALSIPLQLLILLGTYVFLGLGKVGHFNLFELAAHSSFFVSAVIVLVLSNAGLEALMVFNTFIYAFLCFVLIYIIYRLVADVKAFMLRPSFNLFARVARYGLKFHVATFVSTLALRGDLLIVKYFRGAEEAGVYAVASQAGMAIMLLPTVIATLLFPRVAAANEITGALTSKVTRHTAFVMLVVCLLAAPASFAIPVVFGEPFSDATPQLLILLPGILIIGVESVLVQYFNGTGLPRAIPLFWLLTLLVNVALNLILVPGFGGQGAAVSSVISYALIFALIAGYFQSKTGSQLKSFLLIRKDEIRMLWTNLGRGLISGRRSEHIV